MPRPQPIYSPAALAGTSLGALLPPLLCGLDHGACNCALRGWPATLLPSAPWVQPLDQHVLIDL